MNRAERNRLVEEHLPLVGYVVAENLSRVAIVSREDMAGAGAIALVTAAEGFDPERGVPFSAYARRCIAGAIMEELRQSDWMGRRTRTRVRTAQEAAETLAAALGRPATEAELAGALGVDPAHARETLDLAARRTVPLDAVHHDVVAGSLPTPEEQALAKELQLVLRAAVEALPGTMGTVVSELYFEGKSQNDIAATLGITHGAVSQQKAKALVLLRAAMAETYDSVPTIADHERNVPSPARRAEYLAETGRLAAGGLAGALALRG